MSSAQHGGANALPPLNARAETGVSPNKQLLIHSNVMVLNHVLVLQKLATAGHSLGSVALLGVEDLLNPIRQLIKQEQQHEKWLI